MFELVAHDDARSFQNPITTDAYPSIEAHAGGKHVMESTPGLDIVRGQAG